MKPEDHGVGVVGDLPGGPIDAAHYKMLSDHACGKAFFMICGCQKKADEPAGFYPVVVRDANDVYISSLVCGECGTPCYFAGGRLIHEESEE